MTTPSNSPAPPETSVNPLGSRSDELSFLDFSRTTAEDLSSRSRQRVLEQLSLTGNSVSGLYAPFTWDLLAGSDVRGVCRVGTPSFTNSILVRRSGYLVTVVDGELAYFKCPILHSSVGSSGLWFQMEAPPPVIQASLFIKDKEVYLVSERDLRRGRIHKGSRLLLKKTTITYADIVSGNLSPAVKPPRNKSASGTAPQSSSDGGVGDGPNNLGAGDSSELAELQAIDLAFQEQVRSLLGATSSEEIEWQNPENPQPQPSDETGSVPNTDPFA